MGSVKWIRIRARLCSSDLQIAFCGFPVGGKRFLPANPMVVTRAVAHRPGDGRTSGPMSDTKPWTWDWNAIAALGTAAAALLSVVAIIIAARASKASARAAGAAEGQLAASTT